MYLLVSHREHEQREDEREERRRLGRFEAAGGAVAHIPVAPQLVLGVRQRPMRVFHKASIQGKQSLVKPLAKLFLLAYTVSVTGRDRQLAGASIGGKRRAKKLSAKRKAEIARKGGYAKAIIQAERKRAAAEQKAQAS